LVAVKFLWRQGSGSVQFAADIGIPTVKARKTKKLLGLQRIQSRAQKEMALKKNLLENRVTRFGPIFAQLVIVCFGQLLKID
jgi:hypothetical protein